MNTNAEESCYSTEQQAISSVSKKKTNKALRITDNEVLWRQMVDKGVKKMQFLCMEKETISVTMLRMLSRVLEPKHFEEIVEERATCHICAFPLCGTSTREKHKNPPQQYKINVAERKVYDLSVEQAYCSTQCYNNAQSFIRSLDTESVYTRPYMIQVLGTLFPNLNIEDIAKWSKNVVASKTLSSKITEKENPISSKISKQPRNTKIENANGVSNNSIGKQITPETIVIKERERNDDNSNYSVVGQESKYVDVDNKAGSATLNNLAIKHNLLKKFKYEDEGDKNQHPQQTQKPTKIEDVENKFSNMKISGDSTDSKQTVQAKNVKETTSKTTSNAVKDTIVERTNLKGTDDDDDEDNGNILEEKTKSLLKKKKNNKNKNKKNKKPLVMELSPFQKIWQAISNWWTPQTKEFFERHTRAQTQAKEQPTVNIDKDTMKIFAEMYQQNMGINININDPSPEEPQSPSTGASVANTDDDNTFVDPTYQEKRKVMNDMLSRLMPIVSQTLALDNVSEFNRQLTKLTGTFTFSRPLPSLSTDQWIMFLCCCIYTIGLSNSLLKSEVESPAFKAGLGSQIRSLDFEMDHFDEFVYILKNGY